MTRLLNALAFTICLAVALAADCWADKPLVALAGIGIAAGLVWAAGRAGEGKKKTAPEVTTFESGATSKASH